MLTICETQLDGQALRRKIAAVMRLNARAVWMSGRVCADLLCRDNALYLCADNGVLRASTKLGACPGENALFGRFAGAALYELLSAASGAQALVFRLAQDGARRRCIVRDETDDILYDATVPSVEPIEPLYAPLAFGAPSPDTWEAFGEYARAHCVGTPNKGFRSIYLFALENGLWLYLPRRATMPCAYRCRFGAWTGKPFAALLDMRHVEMLSSLDDPYAQVYFAGDVQRQAFVFALDGMLCAGQLGALLPYSATHCANLLAAARDVLNIGLMTPLDVAGRFIFEDGEPKRLQEAVVRLPLNSQETTAVTLEFGVTTCRAVAYSKRGTHALGTFHGKRTRHFDVESLTLSRSTLRHMARRAAKSRTFCLAVSSCAKSTIPVLEVLGARYPYALPL